MTANAPSNVGKVSKEWRGRQHKPMKAKDHPVTQMWYARHNIITPEMRYVAEREHCSVELVRSELAAGRAVMPCNNHPEAEPNYRLEVHQAQRQYGQFGGHLPIDEEVEKFYVGHQVGCRHCDGSVYRATTFTPLVNGFCATPPCRRGQCIRRSKRWRMMRPSSAVPRHSDRTVRARRGLHDDSRRCAAAFRAVDGESYDGHRFAWRFDHGRMVFAASSGAPVYAFR